jgi:L-amino acid N-acyltransferase YncA
MMEYTVSVSEKDLKEILELQKENLAPNLSPTEIKTQGFLTLAHSYEQLKKLNDFEKHVIVKDNDRVIAYLLAMTNRSKFDLPLLIPMFNIFNEIPYRDKTVSDYNYIVVGQACIQKNYRGQGILENCYSNFKNRFINKYDFAITEIASLNLRSLNAHSRIGFREIHRYTDPFNTEWAIVIWDWKK